MAEAVQQAVRDVGEGETVAAKQPDGFTAVRVRFGQRRVNVELVAEELEELDQLKRAPGDLGKNARMTIRLLDEIRTSGKGNLHEGVLLSDQSQTTIRIYVPSTIDNLLEDFSFDEKSSS